MKPCQNCNEPNDDDAVFCSNCGSKFPKTPKFNQNKLEQSPAKISSNPFGSKVIALYEVIVSLLLINFGFNLLLTSSSFHIIGGFIENNTNHQIFGLIFIVWGLVGILAGMFLIYKKKKGYYLSCVFIITIGIIFYLLIFPFLSMILSFIYFDTNPSFIQIFKNQQGGKSKNIYWPVCV